MGMGREVRALEGRTRSGDIMSDWTPETVETRAAALKKLVPDIETQTTDDGYGLIARLPSIDFNMIVMQPSRPGVQRSVNWSAEYVAAYLEGVQARREAGNP